MNYNQLYKNNKKLYLELKKLNINTYLIVSHSLRILEFINSILTDEITKLRIKNTTTFRIRVYPDKFMSIELVYEGSGITLENHNYMNFDNFPNIVVSLDEIIKNTSIETIKPMVIYLTRHGEAEHNIKPIDEYEDTKIDTDLTSNGIEQAKSLSTFFNDNNITFDNVYASELCRTQQTALYASINTNNNTNNRIIIMPGAAEYDKYECVNTLEINNTCSNYNFNKPKYDYNELRNDKYHHTLDGINIDLEYYDEMYSSTNTNIIETFLKFFDK